MRFWHYIFFLPIILCGQSLKKNILNASSLYFRNHIYVYGFEADKSSLQFKIYKTDDKLSRTDSARCVLDKDKVESYLEITADTLHGFLNFYLQKANNKNLAVLIRYNDSLRLIIKTAPFESNKINSLTTFENEIYTFKQSTYTIRTTEDSLGRQYYLNKYNVLDDKKVFEYKQSWQLPLEKRNINSTHVFYADEKLVFVYVDIISGEKKGQWVLKINAENGSVIKGIKLNPKNDSRWFIFNAYHYDAKSKQLLVSGNAYSDEQIDLENNKYTFKNLEKQNTYFFTVIDSTFENAQRLEKTVPYTYAINKTAGKEVYSYHVKVKELKKTAEGEFIGQCAIYKSAANQLLFQYESSLTYTVALVDEGIEFYLDKMQMPLTNIKGIISNDPKDINGKMELAGLLEFDKFLYKWPISDPENHYGKDDLKNPKWVFISSDINTGNKIFYDVRIGLKGIEKKSILESSKYNHPAIYKTAPDKLLIFNYDKINNSAQLQIKTW